MRDGLWTLVLMDQRGRVLAQVLELNSEERAKHLADQWNKDRVYYQVKGQWVVSQLEGSVP